MKTYNETEQRIKEKLNISHFEEVEKLNITYKDLVESIKEFEEFETSIIESDIIKTFKTKPGNFHSEKMTDYIKFYAIILGIVDNKIDDKKRYPMNYFDSQDNEFEKLKNERENLVNYIFSTVKHLNIFPKKIMLFPCYETFDILYSDINKGSFYKKQYLSFINSYNEGYLISKYITFEEALDIFYQYEGELKVFNNAQNTKRQVGKTKIRK